MLIRTMASPLSGARVAKTEYNAEQMRDLLLILTEKEIKLRYKNSWLGYAWSMLNPLSFALVYWIAFGLVMRVQIPDYPLFLIAGLFPWQWLAHSMSAAPHVFLGNWTLLKKVRFARHLLVASAIVNHALHFVLSITVIVLFLLVYHRTPSWWWLLGVPVLVLVQFIMLYGLALAIGSVNLFFRDLDRLTGIAVTFLFFLTPIAYTASMVPDQYHVFIQWNPVAPLMLSWQQLFIEGTLDWPLVAKAYAIALLSLGGGALLYKKLSPKFAEVL